MKERKLTKEQLLKRLGKTFESKILREEAINIVKDYDLNQLEKVVNRAEMYKIDIPKNKKDLDYKDFRKFPKRVQKKIISVLSNYSECKVSFEFGQWEVSPDAWIKSYYAKDHRVFGRFYYDTLVNKVKGLKEAREKEREESAKMYRNIPDSFWA